MIMKLIFCILSQSIIINATCRKNYGSATIWREIDVLSMLFLNFGSARVFIFSYDRKSRDFKIIRVIRYSDVSIWPSKSDVDPVVQRNVNKLVDDNISKIDYKLSQENERFLYAISKVPNYITIIVFAIPLYYALFALFAENKASLAFSIIAVYFLIGCINIISQILSVKASTRSDLNEIITNQAKALYFDWQIRKRENDFYVGLIKNLERSFLVSMICAVIGAGIGLFPKSDEKEVIGCVTKSFDSKCECKETVQSSSFSSQGLYINISSSSFRALSTKHLKTKVSTKSNDKKTENGKDNK